MISLAARKFAGVLCRCDPKTDRRYTRQLSDDCSAVSAAHQKIVGVALRMEAGDGESWKLGRETCVNAVEGGLDLLRAASAYQRVHLGANGLGEIRSLSQLKPTPRKRDGATQTLGIAGLAVKTQSSLETLCEGTGHQTRNIWTDGRSRAPMLLL